MRIYYFITLCIFNLQRRKRGLNNIVQYTIKNWVSSNAKKTLTWNGGLCARMQTSLHSSPMLQVNCPFFEPLASYYTIFSTLIPHQYTYVAQFLTGRRHHHSRILLCQIQSHSLLKGGICQGQNSSFLRTHEIAWCMLQDSVKASVSLAFFVWGTLTFQ